MAVRTLGEIRGEEALNALGDCFVSTLEANCTRRRGYSTEELGNIIKESAGALAGFGEKGIRKLLPGIGIDKVREVFQQRGQDAVLPLLELVDAGNRDAISILGKIGDFRAAERLETALDWPETRLTAAAALVSMRHYPIDPKRLAVVAVVAGDWAEVQRLGDVAIEALLDVGESGEGKHIVQALEGIASEAARDALLKIVDDGGCSSRFRRDAAEALVRSGDLRVLDRLATFLTSPGIGVVGGISREWAAETLAQIGEPAVPALIEAISNWDADYPAGKALVKIGNATGAAVLLRSRHRGLREYGSLILDKLDDATTISLVLPLLRHRDSEIRKEAADTLDRRGWAKSDPIDRIWWLIANKMWTELEKLGSDVVPTLLEFLSINVRDEFYEVVNTLGSIGDPRAVHQLGSRILSGDKGSGERGVHEPVVRALGKIGDPAAAPFLIEALGEDLFPWRGLVTIISGMAAIGDPSLLPSLMNFRRSRVAKQAVDAIGVVLERNVCEVADDDLRELAGLEAAESIWRHEQTYGDSRGNSECVGWRNVSCELVNQLAKQELARRAHAGPEQRSGEL
jgi:HEAT repeat protein